MSAQNELEISKEAIENAGSCVKNKACLKNQDILCPVISEASPNLIYVLKKGIEKCNYYIHFGSHGFCNCPVRKEIHRRYKK